MRRLLDFMRRHTAATVLGFVALTGAAIAANETHFNRAVKFTAAAIFTSTTTFSEDSSSAVTVSDGDGATDLIPASQRLGLTKANGSMLIAVANTTNDTTVAPSLDFLKNGNALHSANTVVASGEILGEINAFGADGTDLESPAARIAFAVDTTPGAGDMPGRMVFSTTADGGETLTEALRITSSQDVRVNNGGGLIVGDTSAQVTTSNGDGATDLIPEVQALGTAKADSSILVAAFNTTDDQSVCPSVNLLKSGHATLGSNTVVASGEVLGQVNFYGADGTDFESAAGRIACIVDTTPGAGDMPGRLVFSTTVDGGETLTEALRMDNAQRLIQGAVASQTVGGVQGVRQQIGTTAATGFSLLGMNSVTDGDQAEFAFLKSGNATPGSFTIVASGESLGAMTWYADDGVDYAQPAAQIGAIVSTTPGSNDSPGAIVFKCTADGAATLTEALRIEDRGIITTLAARPANITAAGAGLFKGGLAMTDVLNALIDDASGGSGTVTHYIGNQSITTSSDARLKKNIRDTERDADQILKGLRVVDFTWDDPTDRDNKYGKHSRGDYMGFIAQEMIDVAPWAVNAPGDSKACATCKAGKACAEHEGYWFAEYEYVVPALVKAYQEKALELDRVSARLAAVEARAAEFDALAARLVKLEAASAASVKVASAK